MKDCKKKLDKLKIQLRVYQNQAETDEVGIKGGKGLKPARVAFVCFESEIIADEFMKLYTLSVFKRIWLSIKGFFLKKNDYYYKDYPITV